MLEKHNEHLFRKYAEVEKNEILFEKDCTDDADYLLVAYGTSARVCKAAMRKLRKKGIKAGIFRPVTLWPFPSKELFRAAESVKKVLTVEMSAGQMLEDVRLSLNGTKEIDFYGRTGGMVPEVKDIVERVRHYEK